MASSTILKQSSCYSSNYTQRFSSKQVTFQMDSSVDQEIHNSDSEVVSSKLINKKVASKKKREEDEPLVLPTLELRKMNIGLYLCSGVPNDFKKRKLSKNKSLYISKKNKYV